MHPFEWLATPRFPKLLSEAGFSVGSLCKPGGLLSKTRFNDRVFPLPTTNGEQALKALVAAYTDWPFDIILPGDDSTLKLLQDGFRHFAAGHVSGVPEEFAIVWERSLGDPDGFDAIQSKAVIGEVLPDHGANVPKRAPVQLLSDALGFAEENGCPVLLKNEYSSSGSGVRICQNEDELAKAAFELLPSFRRDSTGLVFVEQFVTGRRHGIPFVAWDDEVLAAAPHEKTHTNPPNTGVTTVMTTVDHALLQGLPKAVVEATGFQGVGSVEAIIDEHGNEWFIEFNGRFTAPMGLSSRFGLDVAKILYRALEGKPAEPISWQVGQRLAVYPQAWLRPEDQEQFEGSIIDSVTDDPELEAAYQQYLQRVQEKRSEG